MGDDADAVVEDAVKDGLEDGSVVSVRGRSERVGQGLLLLGKSRRQRQ
jgi:hypothetical protein